MAEEPGGRLRVAFVGPMCILDTTSGAAQSMRTTLEMLAAEGFDCRSFTAAVFDGRLEFPLATALGTQGAAPEHVGRFVQIERAGVRHQIFRTTTSVATNCTGEEMTVFGRGAAERIAAFRPHVVLSYGSSGYTAELLRKVRTVAGRVAFYLVNPGIERADLFDPADAILCPSQAQIDLYRQRLGLQGRLFLDPMVSENAADPARTLAANAPEGRRQGFVTFINPAPQKGATLVFALARLAMRARPDLTFLVVESRGRRSHWIDLGYQLDRLSNLWWLPIQPDLRRIYERTSVLLFPSFWPEVSGRCIAEAQLGGIPVLAMRRGGIPEQLNGGGFLFDLPEGCAEKYDKVPRDEEIAPWLDTLGRLMDDEGAYREASARALAASDAFRWETRQKEVAALFRELAADATLPPAPRLGGQAGRVA